MDGFRLAIEDCGLTEVDLVGGEFTWEKSKGSPNWVRERLDRAFANRLGGGNSRCVSYQSLIRLLLIMNRLF